MSTTTPTDRVSEIFEQATIIAAEVSRADDHILTVDAAVTPLDGPADYELRIAVHTIGSLNGTGRLEFRSLDAIDDCIAALASVRRRVAAFVEEAR